jgi:ATP-dependent protease ClpP protease subunit
LEQPNFEALTVLLSSNGGSNHDALALFNFIRSLPIAIHMHAVGHVGSAAVPVFLAGHYRTCAPLSRFFFHAGAWTFPSEGQGSDRIAEALNLLDDDSRIARQIVTENTSIPKDKLKTLHGRTPAPTIINPEDAKLWGLVSEIVELNPSGTPEPGVAVWTVGW